MPFELAGLALSSTCCLATASTAMLSDRFCNQVADKTSEAKLIAFLLMQSHSQIA